MVEETIMEQLVVNAGSSLPFLAVMWMLIWRVWPGVKELIGKNLDNKQAAAAQTAAAAKTVTVTLVLDDKTAALASSLVGWRVVSRDLLGDDKIMERRVEPEGVARKSVDGTRQGA